jgi:hypothetical protein
MKEPEKFVLLSEDGEFYSGKCYIHQGEYWPGTTHIKEDVKVYTSKGRAEKACKTLNEKVDTLFTVSPTPNHWR